MAAGALAPGSSVAFDRVVTGVSADGCVVDTNIRLVGHIEANKRVLYVWRLGHALLSLAYAKTHHVIHWGSVHGRSLFPSSESLPAGLLWINVAIKVMRGLFSGDLEGV